MRKPLLISFVVVLFIVLFFALPGENSAEHSTDQAMGKDTRNRPKARNGVGEASGKNDPPISSGGKTERIRPVIGRLRKDTRIQARKDIKDAVAIWSHPDQARRQIVRYIQPGDFAGYATGKTISANGKKWIEFVEKQPLSKDRSQPLRYASNLFLVKS